MCSPRIAAELMREVRRRQDSATSGEGDRARLTNREREILRLIAEGKSFPEIGSELFIGVTTVKTHVQHVYEKLGVSDRAAAVAEAIRKRLID